MATGWLRLAWMPRVWLRRCHPALQRWLQRRLPRPLRLQRQRLLLVRERRLWSWRCSLSGLRPQSFSLSSL